VWGTITQLLGRRQAVLVKGEANDADRWKIADTRRFRYAWMVKQDLMLFFCSCCG
jgi:hypothetical protein